MPAIMMDLEAVGDAMCQIGAVVFNERTGEFCINISHEDMSTYGFSLEFTFWLNQPEEVRESVFSNQVPAKEGLETAWEFFEKHKDLKIWSHSLYDSNMFW